MVADRPEHSERIEGPTPNGGHHTIAYFSDDREQPCPKDKARKVKIVENDKDGNAIHRTYGEIEQPDAKS